MKKFILYVIAIVGGIFTGMLAGLVASVALGVPFYLALMGGTPDDALTVISVMWFCRIFAVIGAIAVPYLFRKEIDKWSNE